MLPLQPSGPDVPTLLFAISAGVATFFSPCAYPLLPGYVGYFVETTDGRGAKLEGAILRGLAAGLGALVALGVVLVTALAVGRTIVDRVVYFEPLMGVVLIVLGLLVVFDRAPGLTLRLPQRRSGVLGFGLFGAGYALAGVGCVIPVVVGVAGRAATLPLGPAVVTLLIYVGSVVSLLVALTVLSGTGLLAGKSVVTGHEGTIKRIAGAIMVAAGLGQLYISHLLLSGAG